MSTIFIPTEDDFKRWIKEAVKECLQEIQINLLSAPGEEKLLSRKEIAKRLGISLVTLTDWVKRGLPAHKNGARVYFLYSEVIAYLRKRDF